MTEKQKLDRIFEMISEMHAVITMSASAKGTPGEAEYQRAVREMLKGNTAVLTEFLKRGGKIIKKEAADA